ncbi:MAG TPA: Rrf2 family transcriptional regulator [Deltaproteobacteria bacterium]|nr:Rrf2 family transcriptional regulator [Deltaproteobacteria bacterium]
MRCQSGGRGLYLYLDSLHMITGNTHFAIATHVLTALAIHQGAPVTSGVLAQSVDTNPAFLRAVLGRLRDAGLIETRLGSGGGSLLARPASQITLLEVYRATEGQAKIAAHDCSGSTCAIAAGLPGVLARLDQRLDAALAAELRQVSLADLAAELAPPR